MQYKVTNISRGGSLPSGIQLEWTEGNSKRRITPGKFSIVDKLHECMFTWQEKGWAKIDKISDPLVDVQQAKTDKPVTANIQELKLGPDDGLDPLHEDLTEPDIDTGNAIEATLPGEKRAAVQDNSFTENTNPINQSTAQSQDQENDTPKNVHVNRREKKKGGVKATQMGAEPTKKVNKNQQVDAMNPLLDETAKSVDNTDDAFTVQAPDRSKNEQGQTITT